MWHLAVTWVLGVIAAFWVIQAVEMAIYLPRMAKITDVAPLKDADCPPVSILFAGRDEAEKIGSAVASFLAVDYPKLEVVAVDDRSEDATGEILDGAAAADARLHVVHVNALPAGWLGKTYGLQQASAHSTGEWLVFTDADVTFAPDLLRRAVALAEAKQWDHMPLLGHAEMYTAGEKVAMTFFAMGFLLSTRAWRVSDPKSRFYLGVGSFQMIRRSAYEKIGRHTRLAMEVVDDVKLGKLVKQAGLRSGAASAGRAVSVHWHSGVGNIIRGTTKNFFAAAQYSVPMVAVQLAGLIGMLVLPWVTIFFVDGWARLSAAVAMLVPAIAQAAVASEFGVSPLYGITTPVGALIMCWMLLRSTIVTLKNGGITWRGTFYALKDLKRGLV